ncbi:unnamed protein product [Camellia sinensis]
MMFRHVFYKASRAPMAHFKKLQIFKGFSGMLEEMVGDSDQRITRLLFCGPDFPASHNYTREYVQNYPFIEVHNHVLEDGDERYL